MDDFAEVDNKLAAAQLAIGESSNLAQLALTYTYNFSDQKYSDAVCILSVLAQIAIDNSKRKYAIDLTNEIKYIKQMLDIERNGLPKFWQITKKDKRKARTEEERRERDKKNKKKIQEKINPNLECPMNYIFDIKIKNAKNKKGTIPINDFFIIHDTSKLAYSTSAKVEKLIEKYSLNCFNTVTSSNDEDENDSYLLLRSDFEDLLRDIRKIGINNKHSQLMAWLINRAFKVTSTVKGRDLNSLINRNKPLLLRVLYSLNSSAFLSCFKTADDIA